MSIQAKLLLISLILYWVTRLNSRSSVLHTAANTFWMVAHFFVCTSVVGLAIWVVLAL